VGDVEVRPALLLATPADLRSIREQYDPAWWVTERAKILLPKAGKVDFKRYPYMRAVYSDTHPDITIIKGAQLGFSTWGICRAMWMLTTFNCTVIYTFPTREQVSEYTAARIDPIVQQSPYLQSRIVDVNSVKLKKFRRDPKDTAAGVSLIYFQGAAKESDAIAVDADLVIHDEEDKSNPQVIEQYRERLTASRFKWRARLSTPTIPGYGVDRSYALTDQMKWLVTCPSCNAEFEMWFPKEHGDPRGNIEPDTWAEVAEGKVPRYKCHRCDTTLTDEDRGSGRWVSRVTAGGLARGYQVSQMAAPWISAGEILFSRANSTWERDFWNLKIGMAWMAGTTAMTRSALEKRASDDPMAYTGSGCFMGVDVGKKLHVVIQDHDANGNPRVLRIAEVPWDPDGDFIELDEFMVAFGVTTCVVDRAPETGMARRFANRWNRPGVTRVYLCTYKEETANASSRELRFTSPSGDYDKAKAEDVASVKAPRNETMTMVANELLQRMVLPRPDGSPDYEAFYDHCWNTKRTPIFDEGMDATKAIESFIWEKTGPDHFFHAMVYAYLARMGPRTVAPPLRGIISTNRSNRYVPMLPSEDEFNPDRGMHPPIRVQRVG